jgi:integrase
MVELPGPPLSGVEPLRPPRDAPRECPRVGPPPSWHPHQLRHNAATRLRKEFGLDVARAVLGHSSAAVTEIYAELDMAKASEAMGRIG